METLNVPAVVSPELTEARGYVSRLRQFHRLTATAMIVTAISPIVNFTTSGRLRFPWVIAGFASGLSAFDTFGRGLWLGRDGRERRLRAALALKRSR